MLQKEQSNSQVTDRLVDKCFGALRKFGPAGEFETIARLQKAGLWVPFDADMASVGKLLAEKVLAAINGEDLAELQKITKLVSGLLGPVSNGALLCTGFPDARLTAHPHKPGQLGSIGLNSGEDKTCDFHVDYTGEAVRTWKNPTPGAKIPSEAQDASGERAFYSVYEPVYSPDGTRCHAVAHSHHKFQSQYVLLDLSTNKPVELPGGPYFEFKNPIYSPDGTTCYMPALNDDRKWVLIDVTNNKCITLAGGPYHIISDPIYSPDGKKCHLVAIGATANSNPDRRVLIDIFRNEIVEFPGLGRGFYRTPSMEYSPDGTKCYLWVEEEFNTSSLFLISGDKIERIELPGGPYYEIGNPRFSPDGTQCFILAKKEREWDPLVLIDLINNKIVELPDSRINELDFHYSPNGSIDYVRAPRQYRETLFFRLESNKPIELIDKPEIEAIDLYYPDGTPAYRRVTCGDEVEEADEIIGVQDLRTGKLVKFPDAEIVSVEEPLISPDKSFAVTRVGLRDDPAKYLLFLGL